MLLLQSRRGRFDLKGQETNRHLLTLPKEEIDFGDGIYGIGATYGHNVSACSLVTALSLTLLSLGSLAGQDRLR